MLKYDEMRRKDSCVKLLLKVIKMPILGTKRYVDYNEGDDGDDEIRDFVKENLFEEIENPWSNLLGEILTKLDF